MAIPLPPQWAEYLRHQPETGMDYHVVSVWLADGRRFDQAVATAGHIVQVRGHEEIPFTEADEIARIKVTHQHWRS